MDAVEAQTGVEPIIYTNADYATNYLETSLSVYDLWVAHWTYDLGVPPSTGIWSTWDFWQYSGDNIAWPGNIKGATIPGISGAVDADLFNGSRSQLTAFVIGQATEPTITSSLTLAQNAPYYVGQTIDGQFAITNGGTSEATFQVLTIGGRDPDDQVADFTWRTGVHLGPGQSYSYSGALTLQKPGGYHFFCAYQRPDGTWNPAIPAGSGVSNTKDITVLPLPVSISIGDASVLEGDIGTRTLRSTVNVSGTPQQFVDVDYATSNGTATAGSDYTAVSVHLQCAPGETDAFWVIYVPIIGDYLIEGDETFTITLSNPSNVVIADGQAVGTILNDDVAGSIQFGSATYTVNENGGSASISVTRTGGFGAGAGANYATSNGSAIVGSDYTATSGPLTFGGGETYKTFTVPIINDSVAETSKTVILALSAPTGGAVLGSPSTAVLTIWDDDPGVVTITATDGTAGEPGTGLGSGTYRISRAVPTTSAMRVNFDAPTGDAIRGTDYRLKKGATEITGNWLIIDAGQSYVEVTLEVIDDSSPEATETATVTLASGTGYTVGRPNNASISIADDDTDMDWTGTVSDHWENAANWSAGIVPGPQTQVRISGAAARQPVMEQDQTVWGLDLAAGATLTFAPGTPKTLVTKGLTIAESGGAPTARLDLASGRLIVDYDDGAASPLADVRRWIAAGCAGMTWTGSGITSSAAAGNATTYGLGYAQNDILVAPYAVFSGVPVDSSTILVKYTDLGDVNLDGKVDDNDVTMMVLNYDRGQVSTHTWQDGDVSRYDGKIDDNDVTLLVLNYGAGWKPGRGAPLGGAPVAAALPTAAPEVLMTPDAIPSAPLFEDADLLVTQATRARQTAIGSAQAAGGTGAAPPARMAESGPTAGLAFSQIGGTSAADDPPLALLAATSTPLAWSAAEEVAPTTGAALSPDGGAEDLLLVSALEMATR
jgi:hypothetical protein